jgi:hypothetical protein
MKYLIVCLLFLASCTPVQYVYVDPQDSVVKKQRVLYDYQYIPHTPLIWTRPYFFNPPFIVRVPQRRYNTVPQRPQYRPLPPRPPRKH